MMYFLLCWLFYLCLYGRCVVGLLLLEMLLVIVLIVVIGLIIVVGLLCGFVGM